MYSSNSCGMNSCTDKSQMKDKIENWRNHSITLLEEEKDNNHIGLNSSQDNSFEDGSLKVRPYSYSKRKYLVGGQKSQEENTDDSFVGESSKPNGHISFNHDDKVPISSQLNCSRQCFTQNNNLIIDKSNLRSSDEKPCCVYVKFPFKVNNNVYPEKPLNVKDGMEDYFEQFSLSAESSIVDPRRDESSASVGKADYFDPESLEYRGVSYPDQINPLNGEDDDEDEGCIYTYKGDNYEANLSHLLQTCLSCGLPTIERQVNQNGAVSIQRILNGSPRPNPNPQNNLYSPEMDFLEMDFDPGSNGDGGDSDCEDNSILNMDSKIEENTLGNFGDKLQSDMVSKANNIPNELKNFMCRRCELCTFSEQKVNNTSSSVVKTTDSESNSSQLNTSSCNVKTSKLKPGRNAGSMHAASLSPDNVSTTSKISDGGHFPSNDVPRKDKFLKNNLNVYEVVDLNDQFSDGADEADDEGGDESVSESLPVERSSLFKVSSESFESSNTSTNPNVFRSQRKGIKQLRFSSQNSYAKSSKLLQNLQPSASLSSDQLNLRERQTNDCDEIKCENNNLGSISAPEVSPSKEYSPLEKFSRSISFHNQLSSPKYENVCLSHPYKDNFLTSVNKYQTSSCGACDYCSCKNGSACKVCQNTETTNLEACVVRLNQREKSMFNITSDSVNTSQEFSTSSKYGMVNGSPTSSSNDNKSSPSSMNVSPSPIPHKMLQSKVVDLFSDPNTIGDCEFKKEETPEEQTQMEKVMIWTERQATFRQVSQVGVSACGPTAVINVLLALDHSRPIKTVTAEIKTRLRAEDGPLVDYILSRSNAGTSHQELIRGIEVISEGAVKGRFFHMFPKRAFQLSRWLTTWIKKGGVPLATLNLQVGVIPGQTVPDSWHHQMVFGVGPQGIYLTNPLECVSDSLLGDQLCSDSVLLVRRSDIVSRWDQNDKLVRLSLQADPRWNEMNVLGQVICVLKEEAAPEMIQGRRHMTSHVAIPAAYQSGVSIFMRSDNPQLQELTSAPELPLLDE